MHAGGATTDREGAASPVECKCPDETYVSVTNDGEALCTICPLGARCAADQSCALRNSSHVCSNGDLIIGVWETDSDTGKYVLQSCPTGHALINTLTSTYEDPSLPSEAFAYGVQHCEACDTKFEYILDYKGTCKECPR
jgi:hypothetical protein